MSPKSLNPPVSTQEKMEAEVLDVEYTVDEEWDRMIADSESVDLNEYYAKVYQALDGKRHYLFRALPEDFPIMDKIRDIYGTGDYQIWLMRKNKIAKRLAQSIIAPPKKASPDIQPASDNTHVVVQSIEKLGEMVFKMNEVMQARLAAVQQPTNEPLNVIELQRGLIESMVAMKQLAAPASVEPTQGPNAFEAFIKGVEIMKDMDSAGTEKGPIDLLMGLMDVTKKIDDNRTATANSPALIAPGQPVGAQYAPNPEGISTGPSKPQPDMEQRKVMQLKMQLAFLVQQAKKGADPEVYANVILDTVPAGMVKNFITNPDALQNLVKLNPEVGNYAEWFQAVGAAVTEILDDGEMASNNSVQVNSEGVADASGGVAASDVKDNT